MDAKRIGGSNGYSRSPNRCGSYLTVNKLIEFFVTTFHTIEI